MNDYNLIENCTRFLCNNSNYTVIMNESYYEYMDVSFWQAPQLVILVVLFVLIVLGNLCVLLAIALTQNGRKSRMNVFIMNLAIADLSVGIFHVSVDIAEKILVVWYGGSVLCKIVRFLQVLVIYASTFMIVALSIDRVDAIARPMNFTKQATTVRVLVNTAWILSGLMSVPSLLLFDVIPHTEGMMCVLTFTAHWQWQVYITMIALTAFIIPALIIIVCYSIIIFVIWDKSRGFHTTYHVQKCANPVFSEDVSMSPNSKLRYSFRKYLEIGMKSQDGGNKGIIPQAKIKTLKVTLIIVCVFVFSWCPYFVFNLIDVYAVNNQKSQVQYAVTSLIQSLAPLNSAANPLIYGIFGTRICQNLRHIPFMTYVNRLLCKCFKNRRHSQNSMLATDHTNVDATSIRHSSKRGLKNGMLNSHRCFNLSDRNRNKNTNKYETTEKTQNATNQKNNKVNEIEICDKQMAGRPAAILFQRRPTGVPYVNKRMTPEEAILLQNLRTNSNGHCDTNADMVVISDISTSTESETRPKILQKQESVFV